jgi:hypothetical protein
VPDGEGIRGRGGGVLGLPRGYEWEGRICRVFARQEGSHIPLCEGRMWLAGQGPVCVLYSIIGTGVKAFGALAGSEREIKRRLIGGVLMSMPPPAPLPAGAAAGFGA